MKALGDRDPVIVATGRSPIGRAWKGSLVDLRPDDLGASVIQAVLAGVPGLSEVRFDDLITGCAETQEESGGNLARRIAVILGYDYLPGTTVNRACASSTQAIAMAVHAVRSNEGDAFICAGVEMVSRYRHRDRAGKKDPAYNPIFDEARRRTADRAATNAEWTDPRSIGELPDIYMAMGQTAENVASLVGISRREQDEFALRSQHQAQEAIASGFFAREIIPVTRPDGSVVSSDDGPRAGVTLEALTALAPVFRPQGTVTAGNSCPLNDGAAAVIVMSSRCAKEFGLTPLARIVATGIAGLSPEIMGLGPVDASRVALARAGLTISDMDLVEINEAFAVQVIGSYRELKVDMDRLNVHGGGIALGHPYGMTGARIMTTLLNGLQDRDGQFGLETMCIGGGQGMAIAVERIS
jgi:acetyl-CoA C-acetyltransferase